MKIEIKTIQLPILNKLRPNITGTTLKLMEEIGEFTELVDEFVGLNNDPKKMSDKEYISEMSKELIDIAQVAVSLTFVLEEDYNVDINKKIKEHISNLEENNYLRCNEQEHKKVLSEIQKTLEKNMKNYRTISLPKLNNLEPTLVGTCSRLAKHAGRFAQAAGKFQALSGETIKKGEKQLADILCSRLLKLAQVSVSLMFILEEKYNVDIQRVIKEHINKLIKRGYL